MGSRCMKDDEIILELLSATEEKGEATDTDLKKQAFKLNNSDISQDFK